MVDVGVTGGVEDRIAPIQEVHRLSREGSGGAWPVIEIERAGHNCVFEQPNRWRDTVLSFLS